MTVLESALPTEAGADPRRFRALFFLALAQLMVVLDASVVIVALPSAQRALHISVADRQWVMTSYTLAFGSLLLLGGRIADYVGRRRTFLLGLVGFAFASALGGLAQDSAMLFGARALQGAFAAIMAPSALSLLTTTFVEPRERARAFGVYGAIAGGGAAIGLVLGGTLTQFASWRWTLLINVPVALFAAIGASRVVRESRSEVRSRYDIIGTLLATSGLFLLVYGFTTAETDGWRARRSPCSTSPLRPSCSVPSWCASSAPCIRFSRFESCSIATGGVRTWRHCWSAVRCWGPSSFSPTSSREPSATPR